MSSDKEQGFNDAELQDIMSEIENLEREYEGDTEEVCAEAEDTYYESDNIVNLKEASTDSAGQLEFHGCGQVNFSMNFDVAGEKANLEVSENGLTVSLNGMNLTINEESGCTIEMEGGVRFSVPMGTKIKKSKAA